MKRRDWEDQAENWVRWARTPGHDSYADYGEAFLKDIVPAAGRRTLDLGCGEGRVARDLATRGHRVVGIDASPTMVGHAREADSAGRYLVGDAARLPFHDATFDLIVAYNTLMDFDDLAAAVGEAARVLVPAGRLCACVVHPIAEAGAFEEREPHARFVMEHDYLEPRDYRETFNRAGLTMTFSSTSYPLESYARVFEEAAFSIERIREPRVRPAAIEDDPAEARWARFPQFLFMRALKRPG
ncbi:MAG TPA: class I SAM-dependent methyltransferase [Actinomycetota bacterium]|nr:class I SAM-dependent methyltransferase [Actinomycetota bacterium]